MAICPFCLADIPDTAKFCTECGKRLPVPQTSPDGESSRAFSGHSVSRQESARDRSSRLVALGILLGILILASAMLLHSAFRKQSTSLSGREATQTVSDSSVVGSYTLRAYSIGDHNYGSEAVASAGYDDWYIRFDDAKTGEALLFSDQAMPFQFDGQNLIFSDGSSLPCAVSGDTVTITGAATLIFERGDREYSSSTTENPFWLGSTWYGTLEIRSHTGNDSLEDGTREVWGILDAAQDGRIYFELYDVEDYDEDTIPVLSYWITRYEDHIIPDIGEQDAWIFDRWLTKSDSKLLTLYWQDGGVHCVYPYKEGKNTCMIEFTLQPDVL